MPINTAPKLGVSDTGSSIRPSATKRLVIPAVRESSVDQAKPMITSESESTASRPTSQTTWSRRGSLVSW